MAKSPEVTEESPRYMQIADYYWRQIQTGVLRPGDRVPSFLEARSRFGAAQSTLEKAHEVLQQENLIVREPGKGVFVALERRRTRTCVIAISGVDSMIGQHSYYASLLEGIQQAAYQSGLEIMLLHVDSRVQMERFYGVLLYSWPLEKMLRQIPDEMPTVVMLFPANTAVSVVSNDYDGMRTAVEYLVSIGH